MKTQVISYDPFGNPLSVITDNSYCSMAETSTSTLLELIQFLKELPDQTYQGKSVDSLLTECNTELLRRNPL